MSSFLRTLREPAELTVEIERSNFSESVESVNEVLDILRSIYNEQNEHTFQKFSDAYIKVDIIFVNAIRYTALPSIFLSIEELLLNG